MATIRKRGSSWQAQVRRLGSPPISKSFALKADAVLWAREKERSIDRAELPPNIKDLQTVTLADLLARYEAEVTVRKRGADQERYKLRLIKCHSIANLALSKLTSAEVRRFRDARLGVVQAGTVRRELAILQHCLEVARKEWGIPLSTNPVHGITLPPPSRGREMRLDAVTEERLRMVVAESRIWYIGPLVALAIETGMRRSELLSLVWANTSPR